MFAGASLKPDYFKSKINLFVALAPATYLSHTSAQPLQEAAKHWRLIRDASLKLGIYNLFLPNWWENTAIEGICSIMKSTCKGVLDSITTTTTEVDEFSTKNLVIQNVPSGAGYGSLVHYAQLIENAKFSRYNHGPEKNMEKYD